MTYDIIIIGGGPAGLTAAVYGRRANKTVLVIDKGAFGGQITYSPKVENIPGFSALSGNEFADKLVEQAIGQGADFESAEVISINDGEIKTVVCQDGEFQARSIIVATGAKHRLLGVPNEDKFIGDGISFCAVCDGAFYRNQAVGVVGGGNSALQEALLLSELASHVYVIQNLDFLTGENQLQEQLQAKSNVTIITGTVVNSVIDGDSFTGINIKNTHDGKISNLPLDGLFVAIGLVPQNEPFAHLVELDERGYAVSGEDCTSKSKGIFVAGDCRTKRVRQVSTAVADGAVAAIAACEYIDSTK